MPPVTSEQLDTLLQERFGMSEFRSGQREVISRLVAGRSAAAIFPTGGGKSLCYQLPSLLIDGLTLVVSPLLALMGEQVEQLQNRGIAAARLDSTLTADESRQVTEDVRAGKLRLLYVAPERFFNERFRRVIESVKVGLFAIDEAHCISQWGHSFRPDYLKLARVAQQLDVSAVLALTATATPQVLEDICRGFSIDGDDAICTEFFRPNLALRFTACDAKSRDPQLITRLKDNPAQATLVYVTQHKTAEGVAELLTQAGFVARAYHAGMDNEVRQEVQDWFMNSESPIVVATIAFGMGIDKSDIRAIYHYNPSKSIENFAQEIGRAGRDGLPAVCETLIVREDRVILDNFAHADVPSETSVQRFVELMVGQPKEFFVSYYSLAYETDIREPVVRSLMTYLELQDHLVATASRYDTYKFKARVPSAKILEHFEGERRQFAASVLALTVKKKIWFQIDLAQASKRIGEDRQRIVAMLDYFAEKGWIELQVSGLVFGYRKAKPISSIEAMTEELYQYLVERESGEVERLDQLFNLMVAGQCQSGLLSEHFGQKIDTQCGKCSACQGLAIGELPTPQYGAVGDSAVRAIETLAKRYPEQFSTPRDQARFLCGMSSPGISRRRLSREPAFGCCSDIPFELVLAAVE